MRERGPLNSYEIVWRSGHVETIKAHQCLWPLDLAGMTEPNPKVMFHAEINGNWGPVLIADKADIISVRQLMEENAYE